MQTSRLGKLIVVLLGSIGLMYIGGGRAHAETVSVSTQSSSNVTSTSNNISAGQTSVTLSSGGTNDSNNSQTPIVGHNQPDGLSTSNSDTTKANQSLAGSSTSEVDGNNSLNTGDSSLSTTSLTSTNSETAPQVAIEASSTALAAAPASPVSTSYAKTRRVQPTIESSNQDAPIAPATASSGQKPALPTMPQGTTMLVSTAGAPSPLVKFQSSIGGISSARGLGLVILLMLLVLISAVMLLGDFLDHLRAMGSARAPRGATTHFYFAFPGNEFGLSLRLKMNSFFSVLKLSGGSGLYQGGRT